MPIDSGMPAVELENFGSIDILFLVDIIIKREVLSAEIFLCLNG